MANLVDKINERHIRKDIPEFRVGDTVRVDVWVKEGKKERIQAFEGLVIAKKGGSVSETFFNDSIIDFLVSSFGTSLTIATKDTFCGF